MSLNVAPDPVLPEILHVLPKRHGDARGWFSEVYHEAAFREAGIPVQFVQDNHSRSERKGTLRGLHFQSPPMAQAKLVRCVRGRVLDVVVDIRTGSPRFGRSSAFELDASGGAQVFVPEGFAHGFCTLEADTEVVYKVSAYYARANDFGLAHDDPALGIDWPFPPSELTLSERDLAHPVLADLPDYFPSTVQSGKVMVWQA